MRKVAKTAIKIFVVSTALKAAGMVLSRAYEGERGTSDDDFRLLALMDGRELTSEARSLRTGTAVAAMGGVDIDLRRATLDAGGAHICLRAYMGGIRLMVPDTWKVYVDQGTPTGQVDVRTPDPETLGDDAPRLTLETIARAGGILIETEA